MQSQTTIFSKLVGDFMAAAPLAVASGSPCAASIERLRKSDRSSIVVTDTSNRPIGIVTERDVARRIAFRLRAEAPVDDAMTAPVLTIGVGEYLYFAISRMRKAGLRHMPVIDGEGALVGMLNLHDALAVASDRLMEQIDRLTTEDGVDGLVQVKSAQVELARQLFEDNLPAPDIQGLLTHINRDIHRRLVDHNLRRMADEGRGAPPVKFSVIVMGSGGRGENFLFPDQDNGFVLDDYADEEHGRIDDWFIDLAERLTRDLDSVGLPYCKGFVMATNPVWRKTLPQWKQQMMIWARKRGTTFLRLCDIFFDFRVAWGDQGLADDLRRYVTEVARSNPAFLHEMFADDVERRVGLGLFGRFITEKADREYRGHLNLKHTGTLPLVESVRLLALREGVEEVSTLGRLAVLHEGGVLGDDEFDYLTGGFQLIGRLLLRQQIADFEAGLRVSNYVHPKTLSRRERDMLVDCFKAIRRIRDRIRGEFTGDIF